MANNQEPTVAALQAKIDDLTLALREIKAQQDAKSPAAAAQSKTGFDQPPAVLIPERKPLRTVRTHEEITALGNRHSLARPAFAAGYPEFFNPKFIPYVQELLNGRNAGSVRHEALHLSCVCSYMWDYVDYLEAAIASTTITDEPTQRSLAVAASGFRRLLDMQTFRLTQLSVIAEGRDLGLATYAEEVAAPYLRRAPGLSSVFAAAADNYKERYTGALLKRMVQTATSNTPKGSMADPNDGAAGPSGLGTGRRGGSQGGKAATRKGAAAGTRAARTSQAGGDDAPAGQA